MPIYCIETQMLTVAYAKAVGLGPDGCVRTFDPHQISRSDAGLAPLLVYSLVVPAYSCYVRMLADPRNPTPISSFLAMAWAQRQCIGMPLAIEVKPVVLSADRGFASWVRSQGVEVKAPLTHRKITSFERSSQDLAFAIHWQISPKQPPLLEVANAALLNYDIFSASYSSANFKSMEGMTFRAWSERDKRFFDGATTQLDWDVRCLVERDSPRPDRHSLVSDNDWPATVEGIGAIAAMWPGGRNAFLREVEISARDFDFWIKGRMHLDDVHLDRLDDLLGLETIEADCMRPRGGYLLIASGQRDTREAYEVLSHGGDLRLSVEIVGPIGQTLSLRFVLFEAYGCSPNIFLFERNSPAEKLLSGKHLINFGPPVHASPEVWQTMTQIVAHQESGSRPARIGAEFGARHEAWLDEVARQVVARLYL